MPDRKLPPELETRLGDDIMLLVGYDGEMEPEAEKLGWITLSPLWQPIETALWDVEALFWIRPGTREDGDWYVDTSGNPILAHCPPRIHMGKCGSWSSVMRATHWMPIPPPPQSAPHAAEQDTK